MRNGDSHTKADSISTTNRRRTFLKGGAVGAAALVSGCIGWGDSESGNGDSGDDSGGDGAVTEGGDDGLEGTTTNMLKYVVAQAEATQEVLPTVRRGDGYHVVSIVLPPSPQGVASVAETVQATFIGAVSLSARVSDAR